MKEGAPAELRLNETKFGRDMRNVYVDTGIIAKERKGNYNEYRANVTRLREFLVEKDWWVDY